MLARNKNYTLLTEYIQHNQAKFYRVAYGYTKSREDAFDVVQGAVERALKCNKQIKQSQYISTWFYRILITTSLNFIKKRHFHYSLDIEKETHLYQEDKREEIIDLYDALDHLNPEDRMMIILRYFEDMKFKEISEIMGININTLKTRTYRILENLKLSLE